MKTILFIVLSFFITRTVTAQSLRTVNLPDQRSVHFVSPEPIQYVDISSHDLAGDLPLKNVLRVRYKDSLSHRFPAVVTVIGERFIAQYLVQPGEDGPVEVEIAPGDTRPLDISGTGFSTAQLRDMAYGLFSKKQGKAIRSATAFDLKGMVSHIYTAGDYIFLDLALENRTNLRYDLDGIRFKIQDKKVTKAANEQAIELLPVLTLFNISRFAKTYRNIIVLKKVTFPGHKQLMIEVSETPVSGRTLKLSIAYQDILDADVLSH